LIISHYNIIVVSMIPMLVSCPGVPWSILPPGVHAATFAEIEATFAINTVRRDLFGGLMVGTSALARAGCAQVYVDGSYVTGKPIPGDYDVCWEPAGVDRRKLDPVFFDMSNRRAAQKARFKGEYFPVEKDANGYSFVDFFQREKFSGGTKGILSVQLGKAQYQQGGSP
jgi:hypothetical protein